MHDTPSPSSVSLTVGRWAAWAPGVTDRDAWQAWARGDAAISGPVDPDVKFVAPMMRRRLSGLSRMAFRVAADCLDGAGENGNSPAFVFCSRYGEYARSFGILGGFSSGDPVSAAAFSMSVHNTATSLYSIETKDRSAATAMAGGEATLETGFLEAWSLLVNGAAPSVLLIYHDECLPDLYRDQATTVAHDAAVALLLKLPGSGGADDADGMGLTLEWSSNRPAASGAKAAPDPALEVLRLLIDGGGSFALDAGRLVWTWKAGRVAD